MLVGDIVLAVNGQSIQEARSLASALYGPNAPAVTRFDLWRGGTKRTLDVPLVSSAGSPPENRGVAA
jgi:S1-C subfamily serine protease